MDLKYLQTFTQIVETGSFSKAAHRLGYTQSTVSFQIKQLEEELGCRLFDRIGKKISLTGKGALLLEHAKTIDHDLNNMLEEFRDDEDSKGTVHMFSADSICEKMMMLNYQDFYSNYPKIKLIFSTGDTVDLLKVLDKNEADVIFTLDSHIFNSEYVIAKESSVNTSFVAASNHPLAHREHLSIRDLLEYSFLLTERGMSYRKLLDQCLAEMSIELEPVLETGRTDIIAKSLQAGHSIAFLPDFVTDPYVQNGELTRLNVEDVNITIWKQLIYRRDKWISRPLREFIEYVTAHEFEW